LGPRVGLSPVALSPSHTESVYSLVSVSQFSLLEF
jgi:hypothetical protein